MSLPPINQRIKDLTNFHANGSVKKFAELIELNSSQVLNRIFNPDKRLEDYPVPSANIILAIANKFSGLNCDWLLTGKGEMYSKDEKDINIKGGQNIFSDKVAQYGNKNTMQKSGNDTNEIQALKKELELKTKEIALQQKQLNNQEKLIARYEKLLDQ